MSWLLLLFATVCLVAALNARFPLRAPGVAAFGSFFAGWLTGEAALQHALWTSAVAAGLVALGALSEPVGVAGLLIQLFALAGFVQLARIGYRSREVFAHALSLVVPDGGDVATRIGLREPAPWSMPWRYVMRVFPIAMPGVELRRDVAYGDDDPRHRLDLRLPGPGGPPCPPGGRPTFVYVHGGGWVIGNKRQQGLVTVNHLASCGWACFSINYRLSPRATFPDHLVDVKRALAWIRAHGAELGANTDAIVVGGGSAGAHLAALAALTADDKSLQPGFEDADTSVQGCVGFYGVYDFSDRYGHWSHRSFHELVLRRAVMKQPLARAREAYLAASPVWRVHRAAPPFLLIHGEGDSLVPIAEARRFREALVEAGAEHVALVELPLAQHAFEIFPSLRSLWAAQAVERWAAWAWARAQDAAGSAEPPADAAENDEGEVSSVRLVG